MERTDDAIEVDYSVLPEVAQRPDAERRGLAGVQRFEGNLITHLSFACASLEGEFIAQRGEGLAFEEGIIQSLGEMSDGFEHADAIFISFLTVGYRWSRSGERRLQQRESDEHLLAVGRH